MNVYHVIDAAGLLMAALVFYSYVYDWAPPTDERRRHWRTVLLGTGFGAVTIALMIAGIQVGTGTYVDARSVPVALLGLFEGWRAALLAGLVGAAYRVSLGGGGMLSGVAALAATALVAGAVHAWMRRDGRLRVRHVVGLIALTYAVTFAAFLSLDVTRPLTVRSESDLPPGLDMFSLVWGPYLILLVTGIGGLSRLFHDVVEQRRLAAERRRFRAIVDETTDAIRIVDPRTSVILDANRADGELSGLAPGALVGEHEGRFWPAPADPAAWGSPDARGTARARAVPFRRASGEVVAVDATRHRVAYQGRTYEIVIFRAADERLAAEAALREAAELRAASLLARAAAHEINNPLTVILGYVQMLAPRMAGDAKLAEGAAHIAQAGARIRDAVSRLNRIVKVEATEASTGVSAMLDTQKSSAPPAGPPPAAPPAPPAPR